MHVRFLAFYKSLKNNNDNNNNNLRRKGSSSWRSLHLNAGMVQVAAVSVGEAFNTTSPQGAANCGVHNPVMAAEYAR